MEPPAPLWAMPLSRSSRSKQSGERFANHVPWGTAEGTRSTKHTGEKTQTEQKKSSNIDGAAHGSGSQPWLWANEDRCVERKEHFSLMWRKPQMDEKQWEEVNSCMEKLSQNQQPHQAYHTHVGRRELRYLQKSHPTPLLRGFRSPHSPLRRASHTGILNTWHRATCEISHVHKKLPTMNHKYL